MEYGTSYFGVRNRRHAGEDLDAFADEGLNAVLHTFSEADQRYYEGTMQDLVAASHDRGQTVYVNPWAVGRVFGGEALSEFIGRNPEARQTLSTGGKVPAACFNHPDFRAFMREWARDAAGLGADVLFWDEPHWFLPEWYEREYPDGAWGCRCSHCRERYYERYGEEMPREETDRVREFKADELLAFLKEMMAITAEEGAENAVCLLPSENAEHGLEDWSTLASAEDLDVLATDPYWAIFPEAEGPEEFVGYFSEKVADMADEYGLRSQIWILGFRLPGDSADEVRTATRTALDAGVDSVFMWGYEACKSISSIACEDPDAVWEAYLEEVQAHQS
ncbi:MAG: hypothetical protein ABEJ89_07420 [Haloarculaceae archaeon]